MKRINNKIISSRGGKIFKYVDEKKNFFKRFGEIYINKINKNKKIDWIFHKKNQSLITVVEGEVNFFFKIKKNKIKVVKLFSNKNQLLIIPPKTWFRFISISKNSILLNLINNIHDPKETLREKV